MSDFSKPALADNYTAVVPTVNTMLQDLVRGLEPTATGTHSNIPDRAIRWNDSSACWERYSTSGSNWVNLPSTGNLYNINIGGNAATATAATSAGSSTKASNLAGGVAGQIPVQVGADSTAFITPGTAGTVLVSNGPGSAPSYQTLQAFGAGTRIPFAQASAPTGWTQDTTDAADDRMLRVVKTTGGGTGGTTTHSPILMNVVPLHTHGFTTGAQSADHSHTVADPGHSHVEDVASIQSGASVGGVNWLPAQANTGGGSYNTRVAYTGVYTYGMSVSHTHSGSTDNGSSSTNWQPRYINLIICTKN